MKRWRGYGTALFILLLVIGIVRFSPQSVFAAVVWTSRGAPGHAEYAFSTGAKVAAVVWTGYAYTSTDWGATWTEQTGSGARSWSSIASSADGAKLAATVTSGYVYTSTDSGVTWTEQTNSGSRTWNGIASSADGTKLAAAASSAYIYTSTNSGATWTQQTNSGVRTWEAITSSSDGAKLAAVDYGGYIYTSTNSGSTWTAQTGAGSRLWTNITSSPDGTKLAASVNGGYIYTSTDSGATWTEQTGSGSRSWYFVTMSSDGAEMAAAGTGTYVYVSTDSGVTWGAETTPGSVNWYGLAFSSDGYRLVASKETGTWTYENLPPAFTHSTITFSGNVQFASTLDVGGALSKGAGTFVIDHPLDPRNKLLYHSFVESPDVKNLYDGIAKLDKNGEAVIQLPDYFEALNKDFRYQFSSIDGAMPNLYIKAEVQGNQFTIGGGEPGRRVSWQVTGVRHDPYILAHPVIVEVLKGPNEAAARGECIFEPLCK